MKRLSAEALLLGLCCAVWLVSCAPEHEYAYQVPEQTDDGWATASLDEVRMKEEVLGELIKRIDRREYRNVHGILIVKNGKLVFEEYNGGTWKGQQIISQEWVERSTKGFVSIPWESMAGILGDEYADLPETHGDRYGYLWWLKTYHANSRPVDAYFASGWGGQRIFVFPSLDMVVVLTGGNYGAKQKEPVDEIITRYVLPAMQ